MKKIVTLLVALIMVFSLSACGSSSDKKEEAVKTESVEITMDNYSEYLEMVPAAYWYQNDFGEVDSVTFGEDLCVKPEYADRVVYEESNLVYKYDWAYWQVSFDYDIANKTISNFKYINESQDITSPKGTETGKFEGTPGTFETDTFTLYYIKEGVVPLENNFSGLGYEVKKDGVTLVEYIDGYEAPKKDITRIEGTLVIKEAK